MSSIVKYAYTDKEFVLVTYTSSADRMTMTRHNTTTDMLYTNYARECE